MKFSLKIFFLTALFGLFSLFLVDSRVPNNKDNSIYKDFAPDYKMDEVGQQVIVAILTISIFLLMAAEVTSPEIVFLIALCIVTLCEILTLKQATSGFSNDAVVTIGTLFLVVGAIEKSHVVDWFARKTFGVEGSITFSMVRMYTVCFILSMFFNNTPLVAILLPVIKDWSRMRGISASQVLIPLSYSVLAGSFGSMIGTSTNLTVQGLMQADRGYSFNFFAPLPFGVILFVCLLIYMLIAAPYLLPNKSGLLRELRDKAREFIAEVYVSEDSPSIGYTLAEMMGSLGMSPSLAIKIRRKKSSHSKKDSVQKKPSLFKRLSLSARSSNDDEDQSQGQDKKYIKKFSGFWKTKNNSEKPGYENVNTDKIEDDVENNSVNTEEEEEEYIDIVNPDFNEIILEKDVVFIASAQDLVRKMMKSILGESKGLYILKSNVMDLPGFGTEVIECVVSDTNPFIGKTISEATELFKETYNFGIITVRPRDYSLDDHVESTSTNDTVETTEDNIELTEKSVEVVDAEDLEENKVDQPTKEQKVADFQISNATLQYGDTILCVTSRKSLRKHVDSKDFYVISTVGDLPVPISLYSAIPIVLFIIMMAVVAAEIIDICPAALSLTAIFFMGGWLKPKDIPEMIDLRLLMLLGCSLSFAVSMTSSGLAATIAQTIGQSSPTPFEAMLLVYAITLAITELISNNAAAALMYPIAVGLADELGVSFKPFAMCVLLSSTAGFMSPIGYQTHLMVWGPGGYRFKDFIIFGIIPDIIYWIIGCALIVALYQF